MGPPLPCVPQPDPAPGGSRALVPFIVVDAQPAPDPAPARANKGAGGKSVRDCGKVASDATSRDHMPASYYDLFDDARRRDPGAPEVQIAKRMWFLDKCKSATREELKPLVTTLLAEAEEQGDLVRCQRLEFAKAALSNRNQPDLLTKTEKPAGGLNARQVTACGKLLVLEEHFKARRRDLLDEAIAFQAAADVARAEDPVEADALLGEKELRIVLAKDHEYAFSRLPLWLYILCRPSTTGAKKIIHDVLQADDAGVKEHDNCQVYKAEVDTCLAAVRSNFAIMNNTVKQTVNQLKMNMSIAFEDPVVAGGVLSAAKRAKRSAMRRRLKEMEAAAKVVIAEQLALALKSFPAKVSTKSLVLPRLPNSLLSFAPRKRGREEDEDDNLPAGPEPAPARAAQRPRLAAVAA